MSSSSSVFTDKRLEAGVCWLAAAELLALILLLAGAIPVIGVLDTLLSAAAPTLFLAAFAILVIQLRTTVWSLIALVLMVVMTTMVLMGDALQHLIFHSSALGIDKGSLWTITTMIRDVIGNNLMYVGLAIIGGVLLYERRRWLGSLALLNAAAGWLDLAFAGQLGLPPHTNFLLLVLWLVVLGGSTWQRSASGAPVQRPMFAEPPQGAVATLQRSAG